MNNHQQLQALYGLKYNPFLSDIPVDGLWGHPSAKNFTARIEHLVEHGGFAIICGEPGLGKSKTLHGLADKLAANSDLTVGVIERPQSKLSDFYREMGDVFGVDLTPSNRFRGFKVLRERWRNHIKSYLVRPVLLIDEAQEVSTTCLNELRLLGSARFDSECLLTTILCGDNRLIDRFRSVDLLPLGSRIRTRLNLETLSTSELADFVDHALKHAGASHLMTAGLKHTLCEHAAGNLRVLCNMASDILVAGVECDAAKLDEELFFSVFAAPHRAPSKPKKQKRGRSR